METFIAFLPIVIYSIAGTILFYFKKITFNNQMALLALALVAHLVIGIQQESLWLLVGQIFVSLAVFFLLVFFFAGKTSGETILTMTSLLALTPIPHGIVPMILVFLAVLVATAIAFRNKAESVKWLIMDAASSTGLSYSKPDYSHLPDRSSLTESDKRTSILPYISVIMTLASLYYLVQPLFLDS